MPSSISSNAAQLIVNIVYSTIAIVIGLVTVYQGHKAYSIRHKHRHNEANQSSGNGSTWSMDPCFTFQADTMC